MNSPILYEDNHLLIVNKAAGVLAQGDKTGDVSLLDELKLFIKKREHKPGNVFLGLIHRLDRPTSGVIMFAKTSKALTRMNKQFKERDLDKVYWAMVYGEPQQKTQTLTHYLKKNSKQNKTTVFPKPTKDAKKAILHYQVLQVLDRYSLLEIKLETGRSHQIRAQLAKIGHSVKGDLKYGAARSNPNGSIHLHAREITFTHPITKEEMTIVSPTPKNDALWEAVKKS